MKSWKFIASRPAVTDLQATRLYPEQNASGIIAVMEVYRKTLFNVTVRNGIILMPDYYLCISHFTLPVSTHHSALSFFLERFVLFPSQIALLYCIQ